MKKKVLAAVLIAAMAISSTALYAAADDETGDAPPETPDMTAETARQGTPAYARHDAVVKEVTDGAILLDIGEELPETAYVSDETVFLTAAGDTTDISAVRAGAKVSVFVDGGTPVLAIYPAQYPASYVVLGEEENHAGVDIDVYAESDSLGMYLNGAKTLAINVDGQTNIVTVTGSKIKIDYTDLAGRKLAVFYSTMTMSIPAIANPAKVVVLGDAEPAADGEDAAPEYDYHFVVDGEDAVTTEDGVVLVPVRKYAESLGLEVGWDRVLRSVTVGTVPMGVGFKIGENSYSKARMTPFVLEAAPRLIDSKTYVPVSFFEQVLQADVKIAKD